MHSRLEVPQRAEGRAEYLDLLCIGPSNRTAIEFKYFTRRWTGTVGTPAEDYALKGHAAADLARLGRLVVPGRQRIGLLWTIGIGTVAAFIGTGIAGGLGVADTKGVDWVEWLIQIALAAFGVAALSKVKVRH